MEVAFPGPGVGRWLVVVFAIIALFVAVVLFATNNAGWMIALGIAMACFAARFAQPEARVSKLRGSDSGVVTFELYGGGAVELARASLTEAKLTRTTRSSSSGSGTSTSYGASIGKRDGGAIRVVADQLGEEKAQGFVDSIAEILAATPATDESEEAVVAKMRRALERAPDVDVEVHSEAAAYREGADTALSVSWSLRAPWGQALAGVVGAAGFLSIALGAAALTGSWIAHIFTALFACLGLYALMKTLQDQGARQRLVVDRENLTCTRTRGDKALDERRFPVGAIDAVDVGWQTSIVLRLDGANANIRAMTQATDEGGFGTLGAVARGMMAMSRNTVMLPTAALPFETRLAIETVIGAEVAKRSGRASSEL